MISNSCKYAIRAVIYIAEQPSDCGKTGIKQISGDLDLPTPFLAKILQQLAKHKILISLKGPHGGFALGKKPEEISLYDIIVLVDGESYFSNCIIRLEPCSCFAEEISTCPIHKRFNGMRDELISFYKETTLADIIDDYSISGEVIRF